MYLRGVASLDEGVLKKDRIYPLITTHNLIIDTKKSGK